MKSKAGKISNSRNKYKNENFSHIRNENCHPNTKLSRSRSRTDFDNKSKPQEKKPVKKTNIYTLNEQKVNKLSRNNSKEPMSIKTKSFLKPSINSTSSIYRTNMKNEPYSTFGTNKSSTGKNDSVNSTNKQKLSKVDRRSNDKQCMRDSKEYPSINNVRQISLAEPKNEYKNNYAYKKNLSELLKAKGQERGARLSRCGSVSYNPSFASQRDFLSSRRKIKNNSKSSKEGSVDPPRRSNFLKDRKSLGENKYTFHQNSHPDMQILSNDLNERRSSKGKEFKKKGTAASFGGIEALSFNLSSKVKMLKLTHFF